MRTLNISQFLAYILIRDRLSMNDDFQRFMRKLIVSIDIDTEILCENSDIVVDKLFEIQDGYNYDEEVFYSFVEFIEQYDVNHQPRTQTA